jgi:ABC-type nitrate/sulfonate/bicarbonate transport system substrate-binding protein
VTEIGVTSSRAITGLTRRRVLAAAAALPIVQASPALADGINLTVGGDAGSDGAALAARLQYAGLITKAAAELRITLQLQFLDAQVVVRMVQGILGNQIQIGMLGSTPTIRMLAAANPAIPIALAGGGMNFPLMVPPDSPIHDLVGLQGKTVLTVLGSDLHLVLVQMLRAQFGHDDLKRLGITLRNAPALADVGRRQNGIDAIAGSQPFGYEAERKGDLLTLLFNDGTTGAAWIGPEGDGAGHRFRSFVKTPLAPEAFYPHRLWWLVRQDFLQANHDVVVAFLIANARAAAAMAPMTTDRIIQIGGAKWPGEAADQQQFVDRILWRRRGWAWITEADVRTLIVLSAVKTLFDTELKAADLVRLLSLVAPLLRKAWIIAGARPSLDAFTSQDAEDARGPPLWELDRWRL